MLVGVSHWSLIGWWVSKWEFLDGSTLRNAKNREDFCRKGREKLVVLLTMIQVARKRH